MYPAIRLPFHRERVQAVNDEPSMTRQEHKAECDINNILAQFRKTGAAGHLAAHQGRYDDFADIDFHQAQNDIARAKSMFETVPAELRERFHNDPGEFLAFVTDEANLPEMRELGLALPDRDGVSAHTDVSTHSPTASRQKRSSSKTAEGSTGTPAETPDEGD